MNKSLQSSDYNDPQTVQMLIDGDEAAFEKVFKGHYKALHAYAFTILRDKETAEEIVQTIFLKLWEKRTNIDVQSSLKAYLYRSVYNESLNIIKHEKVKLKYQTHAVHTMKNETDNASNKVQLSQLEERLHKAMNNLPEKCRTVFQLSRYEELKYQEIADRLNISIKTVENQMGKALKSLRTELADFLVIVFVLLSNLFQI